MKSHQVTSISNFLQFERVYKFILLILFLLSVGSVIAYICSYWSYSPEINSDSLYGARVVNNIIYQHGHLTDWLFSSLPNYFPDIFLTYIIGLFTHNITANATLFGIIEILYLIFIIPLSLKLISDHGIRFYAGCLYTLSILLLSNEWSNPLNLELLGAALFYSWHFGAFLMGITSLCFLVLVCRYRKYYFIILFYLFTVISIASNLIVGFYFTFPLLITTLLCGLLKFISRKNCIQLSFLLMVTNLSGYLSFKFIPLLYPRTAINYNFDIEHIHYFIKIMINFFHQSPAIAILWLGFLLFVPLSLLNNRSSGWINFILVWLLIMTVLMAPIFIFTDNNLHLANIGFFKMRHLQPLILLPVFLGLPLLIYKHTNIFELLLNKSLCIACFFLIIIASLNKPKMNFSNLWAYYPSGVSCFDDHARKLHLHAGLGNYWQATYFTVLNHSKAKIMAVEDDLTPKIWLTSPGIYNKKHHYDFFIAKSPGHEFDKQLILNHFGQPTSIFSCPGGYEFDVYQNGAMKKPFPTLVEVPSVFKPHF